MAESGNIAISVGSLVARASEIGGAVMTHQVVEMSLKGTGMLEWDMVKHGESHAYPLQLRRHLPCPYVAKAPTGENYDADERRRAREGIENLQSHSSSFPARERTV